MKISPIEIEPPWFPGSADGITLWPFILYRRGRRQAKNLRIHEHFHWYQAQRWGVLPWYVTYVLLALAFRTTGERHPLERGAYAAQRAFLRHRAEGK